LKAIQFLEGYYVVDGTLDFEVVKGSAYNQKKLLLLQHFVICIQENTKWKPPPPPPTRARKHGAGDFKWR
jgi:hypothetical protein